MKLILRFYFPILLQIVPLQETYRNNEGAIFSILNTVRIL